MPWQLGLVAALFGVTSLSIPLAAQRSAAAVDLSAGGTGGAQRVAGSGWHSTVRVAGRLNVGLGVRISAYAGEPTTYTNRGLVQSGLTPTLTIDPAVYALNAAVFGELSLSTRVAVGANLDLVGVATGPERTAGSLGAQPQTFAYFGYGSADRGALNSEFFVSLDVASRMAVRLGASHYVTNYTVTNRRASGSPSSRYQRFETVPFVAVSLRPQTTRRPAARSYIQGSSPLGP